ncbi:DUF1330 domain-containing protein [Nevskia ramosa]|uniref:DUF1330 domain-containing protein n=1 Tax=Nevskia ramosa TaxID=64002 RepID=UPI0003B357AD|nr:DUF1330 domain-containing protein [Nevskia ramosa]
MPALMIALVKIRNPAKLQEYAAAAGPTVAAAGGVVLGRGKYKETLAGAIDVDNAMVARFPSSAAAHDWYHSAAYQALIPVRDEAMEATFFVLDEPS